MNPIVLVPSSPVLHLFQRIRDEAHRFGIENHRRRRSKETIHSLLKQIPGVGPKKQRLLLTAFDSIEAIQRATLEEITAVVGIDQKTAQSIFSFSENRHHLTKRSDEVCLVLYPTGSMLDSWYYFFRSFSCHHASSHLVDSYWRSFYLA